MNDLLVQGLRIKKGADPNSDTVADIEGPLVFGGEPIETIADLINILTAFIFPIAGVLLFLYIAWSGYNLMTSRGDPDKINDAKSKFKAALIGFLLLVFSYFIVRVVSFIFGLGEELF